MEVLLAAVAVVLAALVARSAAGRRHLQRRVHELVQRSEVGGDRHGSSPQASITDLERVTSAVADERDQARAGAARLAQALAAIPQGVVVWDEDGREVLRNPAAVAYASGRHADALVEQAVSELLGAAMEGRPQRRTLDLYGPPRRVLLISAFPLDDGEEGAGAIVVVDDVSERGRLEAMRRDFVANISHELKTPVGAMGLLADTIASEDDPAVTRRLAHRMTGEALRVGRIIDDLLDLTRIEAEEAPRREPVGVRTVVDEAVERVRPLSGARHILVDTDEVRPGHWVRADERQLVSAVANLLENACKYSDEGSTVEVRSRADATSVEISVHDHGIGIPGRDLERVFERFYRVDRARSRGTGGTGLGLAIVRHVATNHQGQVSVASREGEGSVFTLRLPNGVGSVDDEAPRVGEAAGPVATGR
ncbi:MAG: PAS domain-containing protein [Actinobacteria bacterium]|nr:PAS domain-containing protein [Actinomycetota bacterium]